MGELSNYLLQSSVCAALFYMVYYLFLRKLTFFKLNRFYLLASLAMSLFIPLMDINISISHNEGISQFIPAWYINQSSAESAQAVFTDNKLQFSWSLVLATIYIVGVLLVFTRFVISLLIIKRSHKGKLIEKLGDVRVIEGTGKINNCSFLNTIFVLPGTISQEEYIQVIAHEKCHIRLYHTYDKLFVHLIQIVFWFNPFIYLYRRSIDEVHEFEVDALLAERTDKKVYASILLDLAMQKHSNLVNNFSSEPLKTRIKMLFTHRSGKFKTVLYAAAVPVILLTILSFSIQTNERSDNKSVLTVNNSNTISNPETPTLKSQIKEGSSAEPGANTNEKGLDKSNAPKISDRNNDQQVQQTAIEEENTANKSEIPFLVRTTIKDEDGNEYDEVRVRFGKSYNLVGGVNKGGKILFLIGGKEYQEEEVKQFTQADVAGLKCPCSVRAIEKNEPLISGIYDGVIKIANAN